MNPSLVSETEKGEKMVPSPRFEAGEGIRALGSQRPITFLDGKNPARWYDA
jgi:hypothetical protein